MKQFMNVRKTPTAYRVEMPLKRIYFLSACELLLLYDWCASNLEELEREAQEKEQAELEVLFGKEPPEGKKE